jgi:hypothetical protein
MRLPSACSAAFRGIFIATLLTTAAPVRAQRYGSSDSYSLERWEENYAYLKDPAARTGFFDPVKYVPLGADPNWYLSFGGQARERYDYFNNSNFGAGPQDEDGFRLTRLLAHVDAHFGEHFRAFVQLDSSLANDRFGGPRYGDADDFDVQQAFADVSFSLGGTATDSATLRLGRQELIYGAQRLISPNDWANVRRAFDGVKLSLSFPADSLDIFFVRPVIIDKSHWNSDDDHAWLAGLYNVTALPWLLSPQAKSKLDLYLLALETTSQSAIAPGVSAATCTLGTRLHTTPVPWDFDLEADWQFGHRESSAIGAWALAAEAGYTFADAPLAPRAALGIDLASGSANGAHRFNQLFPPQYLHLGHMYVLGRQNLIDLHPEATFNLTRTITLDVAEHFFWRQNTGDATYNLTGGVVRAGTGTTASAIGSEFDAVINWQVQRHLSTYVGYAHFFTGPFLRRTGAHDDMDFIYAAVTFTF